MTINHQHGHRQRLRDRFLSDMGKSMPDYEVLELLLSTALPRRDVKPLAKTLIAKFGNLSGVINADIEDLTAVDGVGQTVAAHLKVVLAASQRASWQKLSDSKQNVIANWNELIDCCIAEMRHNKIEIFKVIFLDGSGKIISKEDMQTGTIDAVYVYPREIVQAVIKNKAKSVVLVHNHPSGNLNPSEADIQITSQIIEALKVISVDVWDHIIVAETGYSSFKDAGILNVIRESQKYKI